MADYVLEILSHYTIDKPGTETNIARSAKLGGTGKVVILPGEVQ